MKISYTWIIIIILVIFMIHKNMNKGSNSELNTNIDTGDVGKEPISPLKKKVKEAIIQINKVSPLKIDDLTDEKEPISIVTNDYDQVINTKPFNKKKDYISPNPEGSTEFRFVDEDPKTAWSTVNVSQHPRYYTSNFEDEKVDTSGFFNEEQFFHDNTSPHSKTNLPDRCTRNEKNEVLCDYNNKLQIIPPRLIQDPSSNLVLNSIGQGNGDIFKTVNSSNVNTIYGNSYQVWDYENEKSINGGKYLDEIVGANPTNEEFMKIGDHKPNYSF